MILIFMIFLSQFLREMQGLQKRSLYLTWVMIRLHLIKYISFTNIGITLRLGENLVSLMNMMLERHKIGMKEDIWRKKTRNRETSV